jgi:enoyl-CoA hydratase/carnithine racemase
MDNAEARPSGPDASPPDTLVQCVNPQEGVAVVILNRPQKLNALNPELLDALIEALDEIAGDETVRALVLTGSGRAFSAGGDISVMRSMNPAERRRFLGRVRDLTRRIRAVECPIIAAINGYAMAGGFEIAASCDFRLVANGAKMAVADPDVNLSPTGGLTWHLPRIVGLGWANYLTLVSPLFDDRLAIQSGFAQEAVPPDLLLARAIELAAAIAAKPPLGVRLSKMAMAVAAEIGHDAAVAWEYAAEERCFQDPATDDAFQAFLDGSLRDDKEVHPT